jgi:DNA-binding HxlR family transcriptional regulator
VTEYLAKMIRDGIMRREAVGHAPLVTEYSLTPLGKSLAEAARPLVQWLDRNSEHVLAQRAASIAPKEVEKFKVAAAGDCHA